MKSKIKSSILLLLHACDGFPMPETALLTALAAHLRPAQPTQADLLEVLKDVALRVAPPSACLH